MQPQLRAPLDQLAGQLVDHVLALAGPVRDVLDDGLVAAAHEGCGGAVPRGRGDEDAPQVGVVEVRAGPAPRACDGPRSSGPASSGACRPRSGADRRAPSGAAARLDHQHVHVLEFLEGLPAAVALAPLLGGAARATPRTSRRSPRRGGPARTSWAGAARSCGCRGGGGRSRARSRRRGCRRSRATCAWPRSDMRGRRACPHS